MANAADTVDALMQWFAVFGVVLLWKSDRGIQFKNEVVRRVQKTLKANRHLITINYPWSNGIIVSACKHLIHALRTVQSELKMYVDEWPEVINLMQSVLNIYSSSLLNKRTPIQVFTGHAETIPLAQMLIGNVPVNAPLEFIKAQKIEEAEEQSKVIPQVHASMTRKLQVISRLLLRKTTTRRMYGRRIFRWQTSCWSRNTARAVRPSRR
jgi:hypothetical protein